MPNLIITKNCNLNCDYCFAGVNYKNEKTDISLYLYLLYLKHLKISGEKYIRLIGGEPLLHFNIKKLILLGLKGKFNIIIFSNLTLPYNKIKKIFDGLIGNILVNVNINRKKFYKKSEIENLFKNLSILKNNNINIKLSYLVYNEPGDESFIFELAYKYGIKNIHLKPYNYNGFTLFNTNTEKYGNMFYNIITKYGNDFKINISCGFSNNILSLKKQIELREKYNINFKFGCYGNGGKYDINYDGKIFRCFALEDKFKNEDLNLYDLYKFKSNIIIKKLQNIINTDNNLNCLGYMDKF